MKTNRATLLRSASNIEVATEGRTLLGRAVPWDSVSEVNDFGGPVYREAFSPTSADETLRRNPEPRPFFANHGHVRGEAPIGVVHFQREPTALMFAAPLSRTRSADEHLALVRDGAELDVSVGFRALQSARRRDDVGTYVYRTEMMLRELSLAATGYGQHANAKVLALRSASDDMSFSDIEDAVQAAVVEALGSKDDYAYVRDLSDSWVVYCTDGGVLHKVSYVMDTNGEVTLADDATEVTTHTEYVAVSQDAARSHGLSATPKLDAWRRRKSSALLIPRT